MTNTGLNVAAESAPRAVPVMDQDRSHASVTWDGDRRPHALEIYDGGNAVCVRFTFRGVSIGSQRKREFRMKHLLDEYERGGVPAARAWADRYGCIMEQDLLAQRMAGGRTTEMALYDIATGRG